MIHDKMLSWQLTSLIIAHSLEIAITLSGLILSTASWLHPAPNTLSNQLLKPPCLLASHSVLPLLSPNISRTFLVYQYFAGKDYADDVETHGCGFCPTRKVPSGLPEKFESV